jgi:regulator-associated protein of mTOR
MTAVAVQPNGSRGPQFSPRQSQHSSNGQPSHRSRSQPYAASPAGQIHGQEAPVQNAASPMMNPRPTVSNTPAPPTKEEDTSSTSDQDGGSSTMESSTGPGHDGPVVSRRLSLQARPTSSPAPEYSSQDESERDKRRRRPRPLLQRSKSDYGPRGEDRHSPEEEETQHWGARHGFDDHYASEEYVSQLANVSCFSFILPSVVYFLPCCGCLWLWFP